MKYPIVFKSINISDETHKKLESIGKVKETFDDVIKRLLDNYLKDKVIKNILYSIDHYYNSCW